MSRHRGTHSPKPSPFPIGVMRNSAIVILNPGILISRPPLASCVAVDYSRLAAGYDRSRADDRIDREYWLRGLIDVGEIEPGDRILDLGAGTGRFSRFLSEANPLVALDASRERLALARGKGAFAI